MWENGVSHSRGGRHRVSGLTAPRAPTPLVELPSSASADFTKSVQPYWLCKTPTPFGVGVLLMRAAGCIGTCVGEWRGKPRGTSQAPSPTILYRRGCKTSRDAAPYNLVPTWVQNLAGRRKRRPLHPAPTWVHFSFLISHSSFYSKIVPNGTIHPQTRREL